MNWPVQLEGVCLAEDGVGREYIFWTRRIATNFSPHAGAARGVWQPEKAGAATKVRRAVN